MGDSPTGVRVRSPVAWVAPAEETKLVKPTDKAIFGMVSESPGRKVSEPTGGPVNYKFRRPSPLLPGEGSMAFRNLTEAKSSLRRGGRGSTVTRTCQATGEAVLVPSRNRRSKVDRITGTPGKSVEDETVAAGLVVAMKRGNSCGAKEPCCT